MANSLNEHYLARINLVMDYIESNYSKEFTLDELAFVANFSKYHFHRIFYSMTGETLFQFIQRIRIEKAAVLILNQPKRSFTEIAYECGFSSSALFSKTFKNTFQVPASLWKKRKKSNFEKEIYPVSVYDQDNVTGNEIIDPVPMVTIREIKPMTLAYVRHTGPYKQDVKLFEELINRLCRWAAPRGLVRFPQTEIIVVYHDDPEITACNKLRISVGIIVPEETKTGNGIGKMTLPGGEYAFGRCKLKSDEFQKAWDWVYGVWFPKSGYEPDNRSAMEWYPDQSQNEETGRVLVDICVPVKSFTI